MKYSSDFSSRFRILKGGKISLVVSALVAGSTLAFASPTGGQVITGSANISQSGTTTTINQSTNKASINWNSFNITPSETVNFVQPSASSATLNRVIGATPSMIEGVMNANGQVFLVNPNGVVFSKNATVNVGGLVASTLDITDANFQAGNYAFEGNSQNGVLNMGTITTTNGGYVAMIGKTVQNEGTIVATMGNVQLAGADKISLNLNGNSLVKLTIDEGTLNALVENKGLIKADGGQVFLTTQALNTILDGMVNNTGVIEAKTLNDVTGNITLYAHGGTANVGGILDASAPNGGNGGFIETSGAIVNLSSDIAINAGSVYGKGGAWLLDPYDYVIDATAASTIVSALNGGTSVTISTATNSSAGISGNANSGSMGDITVSSAINKSSGTDATLTLQAADTIVVNAPITSTVGKLNISLLADNDSGNHDGVGIIMLGSNIATNGGTLNFGDGATKSINGATTKVGGDVYVSGGSAISLATSGGNINVNGEMIIANPNGLTVDTVTNSSNGGGNVSFGGLLNSGDAYTAVAFTGSTNTWDNARTAATGATDGLADIGATYLATINSRLVNSVAAYTGNYNGAWLGGFRDLTNSLGGGAYTWYWVGGSQKNQAFFQQNVASSSGTGINGQYSNFGSGEPNGNGPTGESALQFFGTAGQWNDLSASNAPASSGQYGIAQYIKETNLANSSVAVNAGSGTVTFSGAVGATKALSNLTVNAGVITTKEISVNNNNNVAGQGKISLTSLGNITLTGNIATTDTSSTAVFLSAGDDGITHHYGDITGGNIILSGSPTISTGTGGKALLYTGSIAGSTGLAIAVGIGHSRYNSDTSHSGFSTALGSSGIYAIYREQPIITVTADNQSKIYDGQALTSISDTSTISGLVNGDTQGTALTGSGPTTYSVNSATNVASYTITSSGGTYDGSNLGYAVAYATGLYTITPKALTVSGLTVASKTYDGSASATLSSAGTIDKVGSDDVSFATVATFDNANVENTKTVDLGYTLSGAAAGNYTLANVSAATTSALITPKALTVSGLTVNSKTYDGLDSATVSSAGTIDKVGSDDVSFTTVATFDNANVENTKTLNLGYALSGTAAGNYTLADASAVATAALISKADATVTANTDTKTYNGVAQSVTGFTAIGLKNGETTSVLTGVSTSGGIGTDAGTYAFTASGADRNYNLTFVDGKLVILPTVNDTKTTIINQASIPVQTPVVVLQPQTPNQIQNTTLIQTILPQNSADGTYYNLVGTTDGLNVLQTVSVDELQKTGTALGISEIRVPVGQDSMVELINGGLHLPNGVFQEFYIVSNNTTTNSKKNKKR